MQTATEQQKLDLEDVLHSLGSIGQISAEHSPAIQYIGDQLEDLEHHIAAIIAQLDEQALFDELEEESTEQPAPKQPTTQSRKTLFDL